MGSKVIIVTGASRGIGLAVAKWLIKNEHKVVLVSRTEKALQAIKSEHPGQVDFIAADLSDCSTAPKVTEFAVKTFGRLDGIVINHAVIGPIKRLVNSSIEEWSQVYNANLFSALALVKASIPLLRETKGRIVFTSSGAAVHGYAGWGAYGSSKAAMNSLAQHIAVEEPEIATVAVGPGRVDTQMQVEIREQGSEGMTKEMYADFVNVFENGKLNKPEWPGNVIAKLAVEAKPELNGGYFNWNGAELAEYRDKESEI
ncbi:hypothetical protein DL546_003040 [Coniochaeta pulveracea]|uniref:Ketoreductase domain-containing protein n=1 Tax=Coniochaeta pulveracea TaxID=177199 RepID=A0A420XY13_9PEZI|nr:hypothetical protein DL546_003040 [Coniochaeta pulveracea]